MDPIGPMQVYAFAQQERERGQQNKLARLTGEAYADPTKREGNLATIAAISPDAAVKAREQFGHIDDTMRGDLARASQLFVALPAEQRAAAYPELAAKARALRLPVPGAYDPKFDPMIEKIAGWQAGNTGAKVHSTFISNGQLWTMGADGVARNSGVAVDADEKVVETSTGFALVNPRTGTSRPIMAGNAQPQQLPPDGTVQSGTIDTGTGPQPAQTGGQGVEAVIAAEQQAAAQRGEPPLTPQAIAELRASFAQAHPGGVATIVTGTTGGMGGGGGAGALPPPLDPVRGGQLQPKGLTPQQQAAEARAQRGEIRAEAADRRAAEAAARAARGNPPAGFRWNAAGTALEAIPGGPKPAGAAASEDERKAAAWHAQATNAYANMVKALKDDPDADAPGIIETYSPNEELGNWSRSDTRQRYTQAAESLSEALLRAATGAGINEHEARQKVLELTPRRGDSAAVKKQKLDAIPVYLEALRKRAGRALPQGEQAGTAGGDPGTVPAAAAAPASAGDYSHLW